MAAPDYANTRIYRLLLRGRPQMPFGRIEQCDNHDSVEVVDDCECREEYLHGGWHPVPEQRKHSKREGDVGGRRDRPTRYSTTPLIPGKILLRDILAVEFVGRDVVIYAATKPAN